ncbi:hypothetical protein C1646_684487 [Rhizophagus diaphanus]|nr:hypothetical protein C1646_684487 [Rhizophagus diaphanus] [Rhizophagus sp. MUCL 43196]
MLVYNNHCTLVNSVLNTLIITNIIYFRINNYLKLGCNNVYVLFFNYIKPQLFIICAQLISKSFIFSSLGIF